MAIIVWVSPVFNEEQFHDQNGNVAAGYWIQSYQAYSDGVGHGAEAGIRLDSTVFVNGANGNDPNTVNSSMISMSGIVNVGVGSHTFDLFGISATNMNTTGYATFCGYKIA